MKIGIVVGTRPEIIKMSPIIKYCELNNVNHEIIHSQQHYSSNMDRLFFSDLDIKYPKLHLGVKSKKPHLQTAEIMSKCGEIFLKNGYDIILVQGDTNTVLGAALAANKCNIKIGHVEAGLRSFDFSMPEEINRIIADNISDYCFAPTEKSAKYLRNSGIEESKIYVVGNTIVDSIIMNKKKFSDIDIKKKYNFSDRYALVTLHRPSNVDNSDNLISILNTLNLISIKFDYEIIFPVHPRTKKNIDKIGLEFQNIKLIEPMGYFDFLSLIFNSSLIFTDSGGIQEEACILHKPCITLRNNTERPETVLAGANLITGLNKDKIVDAVTHWQNSSCEWINPFGNGDSSKKIIDILKNG